MVAPRNDVWETSAEIPCWWRVATQIWLGLLIGRASQKHYPYLGSDASSVTVRTLHLEVINWILLQRVQLSIFDRVNCTALQSRTHLTASRIFESSEQSAVFTSPFAASGRSFIKMTNIDGPRILPWGTPEATGAHWGEAPSRTTRCQKDN